MGPMGPIGRIGLMGRVGRIGLMGLMGLVGLGLMGCSSGGSEQEPETPQVQGTPIAFSALEGDEKEVSNGTRAYGANETNGANGTNGANRANGPEGANRAFTRATSLHDKSVDAFRMWGYKNMSYDDGTGYGNLQLVFPCYYVHWIENSAMTSITNTHNWDYILMGYPDQTVKYWDWSASAYRFFGVAETVGSNVASGKEKNYGINEANWAYETNGPYTAYELSFTADAANDSDAPYYSKLWFSNGSRFGQPVQLEFMKPFAKVRFMFTYSNTDPEAEKPELEDPVFRPITANRVIYRKGTFIVSYPITGTFTTESWRIENVTNSITGFTVPYTVDVYDNSEPPSKVETGNYHWEIVLPAKAEDQGAFQLTVTVNGEDKTCTVPEQYMNWQPGYSYTYVFKVNEEGGVELGGINVAITEWGTGLEDDYIIYNW